MDNWLSDLRQDLQSLEARALLRRLRPVELRGRLLRLDGQTLVSLASNDYLGIGNHPHLAQASSAAATNLGTGTGASRLVSGHLALTEEVERRFAAFKHAEAALITPTGYMANLAVLTALARPGDLVCVDKLDHASLIDGARASGATVRVFPHLNVEKCARLLERHAASGLATPGDHATPARSSHPPSPIPHPTSSAPPRRFIVTDAVFSMDGDAANLPALAALADRFDAILIVDEAHGTGVLGATGGGLCEHQGVAHRVDVVVSTASKALGGLGGIITARHEVIQAIVNHARSFIFTTAVPPAQVATIGAALDVLRDEPHRLTRLREIAVRTRAEAALLPWLDQPIPPTLAVTPLIPLIVGAPVRALALAEHLQSRGFFAPAIRPPTVAPGASRVRLSLRADLEDADLDGLMAALRSFAG